MHSTALFLIFLATLCTLSRNRATKRNTVDLSGSSRRHRQNHPGISNMTEVEDSVQQQKTRCSHDQGMSVDARF
jgi:hypothetical protein